MLSALRRSAAVGLVMLAACVSTGCAGSDGDKAGGAREGRAVVLTIATRDENDAFVNFASAVEAESKGALRLEPRTGWRAGSADFERATIADVRNGVVDLAEVGAGVWDTVGVSSFRALVAPFLIDDLGLERHVLESSLVPGMLAGVRPLGLVGLAVLPGPLRRPLGISRELIGPEDYAGAVIAGRSSRVGQATWAALGARAVVRPAGAGVDGTEQDLTAIDGTRLDLHARALTANVVLWPRVRTIVVNRRAFETLTPGQRAALRRAGRAAIVPALRRVQADEVRALARICGRAKLPFVSGGSPELAALSARVRPVYALLERDPPTRAQIAAIRRMAGHTRSSAAVECGRSIAGRTGSTASRLDGTWRMTVTRRELVRLGTPPNEADAVRGSWRYTIGNGRFEVRNLDQGYVWAGRAFSDRQKVTIVVEICPTAFPLECSPGEAYEQGWSLYRDTVTFTPIAGSTYAPIFIVKPWTRLE